MKKYKFSGPRVVREEVAFSKTVVAGLLGVSERQVYYLLDSKKLRGTHVRDLLEYVQRSREKE